MRRLLCLAVVVLAAGCFNPTFKDGIECSSRNTCPPGFGCNPNGNVCERNFVPDAASDGRADRGAEASMEAPPADATSSDADAPADASDAMSADAAEASDAVDMGAGDADASVDALADKPETGDAGVDAPIDLPADKAEAAVEAGAEAGMEAGPEVGPPPGGLICRWALGDEHTADDVVPDLATADGAQNGVIYDNGEYLQTVKDRNGVANKAISITADDFVSDQYAYIKVQGVTSLPPPVTITAWIAFTVGNQLGLIAGINHGPQLYMDEYHVTVRMPLDSFNYGSAQGPLLTSGQWIHVAGVVAPSGPSSWKLDLYVNGALYESATIANDGVASEGNTFNIGGMYGCSGQGCNDGFKGYLDDVRVYDHALTAAEVLAVYKDPTN